MKINLLPKPRIGDKKRGRQIGRASNHLFIWLPCGNCGKERWVDKQQIQDKRYLGWCRKCGNYRNGIIQGRRNRKTGRRIHSSGYIEILIEKDHPYYSMVQNTGYIREHRLVMAQKLGRCLMPTELVHHKDGKKAKNDSDNLTLENKNTHGLRYANAYKDGYLQGYLDGLEGKECELI